MPKYGPPLPKDILLERQRARDRKYYKKIRSFGLCKNCGANSEKFSSCLKCRKKENKRKKEKYWKNPEFYRARLKKWRASKRTQAKATSHEK